jgi:hypothetical protein
MKTKSPKKSGNFKPSETQPLIMAAIEAFEFQNDLGLTDGMDFNQWRRHQVFQCVGKTGLSACVHDDFQPLMSHFKLLAGEDAQSFVAEIKTGPARDRAEPGDTHEARRTIAYHIVDAITRHQAGGGKIGLGYVVTLARHKTRRRDLTLKGDFQAALADRCTVQQLDQIRSTIINRIDGAEGRGDAKNRNRSQRGN